MFNFFCFTFVLNIFNSFFRISIIPFNNFGAAMMRELRPVFNRIAFNFPDASFVLKTQVELVCLIFHLNYLLSKYKNK